MELGISMFGDIPMDPQTGKPGSTQKRLQELIEEIKLADEVGLHSFGIGEHHRPDYAVAATSTVLAAAASVTRRIKLGSAVTVLSSEDPVRVYQQYATIDLLSNGRAEMMVGRGSFIESFPLFGYNLDDYNALFEEKLNLLLQINRHEIITWKGKFRAPLYNQQVLPRASKPLPVWIAVGGTPASVIRAGKLGLPLVVAIIGGQPSQFKELFALYKKTYQENGHDMQDYQVGIHAHTFIGEEAEKTAAGYYPIYAAQMDRIGQSRGWPPYSKAQYHYGRGREGALLIGDPSEVSDKILYLKEMFGLTRFIAHMDVGAPAHKEIMKSIELYGTKVAEQVK